MEKRKIAIQGIKASFHDVARRKFFGVGNTDPLCCKTFEEVCFALVDGHSAYGLMAIENTSAGSILTNYQLIQQYDVHIAGEVYLPIHHTLMAAHNMDITQIAQVISHPMALRQCSRFFRSHSHIVQVERFDTAGSALEIAEKRPADVAAIAPAHAAVEYDLHVVQQHIENNRLNETRFLVLAPQRSDMADMGDKASLCFELRHEVGSLRAVMGFFEEGDLNMTKIQSVPLPERPYNYQFHLDLTWDVGIDAASTLRIVEQQTINYQLLGIYQNGKKRASHTAVGAGILS